MIILALVGLVKMELPTGDVLWCDGGFQVWGADTFTSKDDTFGVIASIEPLSEGITDEVPAMELVIYPAGDATPADLSQPGFQTSRIRFWVGEYDRATGLLIGTPELIFDGMLDQTRLTVGKSRQLAMSIVSLSERMLAMNIGNSQNPNFHKLVWPGETGHDNATGLSQQVAWGTELPAAAGYVPAPVYGKGSKKGNR